MRHGIKTRKHQGRSSVWYAYVSILERVWGASQDVSPAGDLFVLNIMNQKNITILYRVVSSILLVVVIVFLAFHIRSENDLSDLGNRIVELESDLKNTKEVLDSHGFEDLNLCVSISQRDSLSWCLENGY